MGSSVLHRNIRRQPPLIRGQGHYIIEKKTGPGKTDRALFDASCGAGVTILGNTMQPRVKAARDRVECEIIHLGSMIGTHEATEEFARFLEDSTNGKLKLSVINNSGK